MKLTFLGATGTVTGSKYLLEHHRLRVLIDCGLFQGHKKLRLQNWEQLPLDINSIDAVILTHAHIDHSGYIPRLIKEGFKGAVYCTPSTRDLCRILLPDCGFLMEEEARYANKKGFSKHKPAMALYTEKEAVKALKSFRTVPYGTSFKLKGGLDFEFRNAGHILGSANVTLSDGDRSICFSGDVGRVKDPLLYPPVAPAKVDYLVVESTYGNRIHSKEDPMDELEKVIKRTVARGGVVVIPSFAVGRAQHLLYYLHLLKKQKRIPSVPIYLNSPMASKANEVFCARHESFKLNEKEAHKICQIATVAVTEEDSRRLNTLTKPAIILSASGMATGGRVVHHIKTYGANKKNTLLFTGFQVAGTRGQAIVNGCESV